MGLSPLQATGGYLRSGRQGCAFVVASGAGSFDGLLDGALETDLGLSTVCLMAP
eukprot:COSAG02_NODE_2104_length_9817_cov_8.132126_1_plen_54_part_00